MMKHMSSIACLATSLLALGFAACAHETTQSDDSERSEQVTPLTCDNASLIADSINRGDPNGSFSYDDTAVEVQALGDLNNDAKPDFVVNDGLVFNIKSLQNTAIYLSQPGSNNCKFAGNMGGIKSFDHLTVLGTKSSGVKDLSVLMEFDGSCTTMPYRFHSSGIYQNDFNKSTTVTDPNCKL